MNEPVDGHDGPYAAPVRLETRRVPREWIDYNGHMNTGYYTFAFDAAIDAFLQGQIGVGPGFASRQRMGPYTLQNHIHYLGELLEGASFHIACRLIDHDAKRVHVFMELIDESDHSVAATCEQLLMNVDLNLRRSAPYPDWTIARLRRMQAEHATLDRPAQLGAPLGIRRKG